MDTTRLQPLPTLPDLPQERPRIAYLITSSEIGGAQTHVADLLRAMRGQVDAVLMAGGNGPLFDLARDLGIPSVRLAGMDNALSPAKAVRALQEVVSALRQAAPDIIHTHSAKASALGRIAGRLLNIPVVYTVHGFAYKPAAPWKHRTVARVAEWLLAPLTSQVICVSEAERAMAARLPIRKDQVTVIPNGIADMPQRANPGAPLRRIVTVMRLAAPKRPDLLIDAFAAAALPECEMVIAGDGPQRDMLERLANEHCTGRVRFVGSTNDIPTLLSNAQAFVLASDHEGAPISILEAMRAGLPIVASDLPGIRDQLDDGACGMLIDNNDTQAFTMALQHLADNDIERIALGHAARARWASRFGLDPMVDATSSVYQRTLAGARPIDTRVSAS